MLNPQNYQNFLAEIRWDGQTTSVYAQLLVEFPENAQGAVEANPDNATCGVLGFFIPEPTQDNAELIIEKEQQWDRLCSFKDILELSVYGQNMPIRIGYRSLNAQDVAVVSQPFAIENGKVRVLQFSVLQN